MKRTVALVLSSGGSKGLAHIGAIKELERQGFEITSISGSSIGSVIGGLHAMGKLDEYTAWMKTLNKKLIWGLMDFTLSTNGILKGNKVFEKMESFIPDVKIEDMKIPFTAVATDILNEQEIAFNSGSFYASIRASVAIPSLITPVKYKNTFLVDGGVLNPVPIEHVVRNDSDILVVVNLYGKKNTTSINPEMIKKNGGYTGVLLNLADNLNKILRSGDRNSPSYFSLLSTTTNLMIHKLAQENIIKHEPDILIELPHDSASTFDFHKADELIELGKKATEKRISNYNKEKNDNGNSNNMCV